jgi:parvulin-like peptidyl-prolyl isomerase
MSEIERIKIQHILVSFDATPVQAKRTKEDAQALAGEVLERAIGGADFTELVREHSDDPIQDDDPTPGVYRLLNNGIEGENFQEFVDSLNAEAEVKHLEIDNQIKEGEITEEEANNAMQAFVDDLRARGDAKQESIEHPRAAMVPAFGDVGFSLDVDGIGVAEYDEASSPFGWHIIKRLA